MNVCTSSEMLAILTSATVLVLTLVLHYSLATLVMAICIFVTSMT